MFIALHKRLGEREEGFTLIELLVVVIIIGILAAIAIPTFLNQRENAWARATESDLRNAAIVGEEFANANTVAGYTGLPNTNMRTSDGVAITVAVASGTRFCLNGNHDRLGAAASVDFHYDSATGEVDPLACTP